MGNVSSTVTKQTMSSFTDYCNTVALTAYTEVKVKCNAGNYLNLQTGGAAQCGTDASAFKCVTDCPFTVTQIANSICSATGVSETELQSEIVRDLDTTLQGFVDTKSDVTSEWLQTAINVNSVNIQTTEQLIEKIETVVSSNSTLICDGQVNAANQSIVMLCGTHSGPINFTQNASAQMVANCVNSAVLNAFEQDTDLKKLSEETDAALNTKGGGLGFLGSWWFWLIIGIVVIVVVVVIILLTKKKKQPQQAAGPTVIYSKPTTPPPRPPQPSQPVSPVSK